MSDIQTATPDHEPAPVTRVLIADRHRVVRAGLAMEIERQPDLQLVGEAVQGADVLQLVAERQPDVLVLDVNMPGMNGVQITHRLYDEQGGGRPTPQVLIFSAYDSRQYVWSALAAGARGYLLKSEPPARIVEAIHALHRGQVMLSAPIQALLVELFPLLQQELTAREVELMQLLARGFGDRQIAAALHISESTVRSRLSSIYRKVPLLRTRAEAIAWAWVNQVVSD